MKKKMHELKADKQYFADTWSGTKRFELRFDDRDYQVGDYLKLKETEYSAHEMEEGQPLIYTGNEVSLQVTNKLENHVGLKNGWCILSVIEVSRGLKS